MDTSPQQPSDATVAATSTSQAINRSKRWQQGRRLTLTFHKEAAPELHKIEFVFAAAHQPAKKEQEIDKYFSFSQTPQALSLLLLDYVHHAMTKRKDTFFFRGARIGSLAASLGNALGMKTGFIPETFVEWPKDGIKKSCVDEAFDGRNLDGKSEEERRVWIRPDFLPADCIEIVWDAAGKKSLTKSTEVKRLKDQIRRSLEEPIAIDEPEEDQGNDATPVAARTIEKKAAAATKSESDDATATPQAEAFKLSQWLSKEFGDALKALREQIGPKSSAEKEAPTNAPRQGPGATSEGPQQAQFLARTPTQVAAASGACQLEPKPAPASATVPGPKPPPSKIDPRLFEIQNPEHREWDESEGLINFGSEDSDADVWRIRDASEGVLIFGAVGSGKTSSSGSLIARQYLSAGYGGLVLTAKPDEAERWIRLCEETGRKDDCIHVTARSGHALNIFQYETQRPGDRVAVTDDLIALFRCVIGVMSRSQRGGVKDDFWSNSTNDLMRRLFDIFLLAGEPLWIRGLARFLDLAPIKPTDMWRTIEHFGDIIARAEETAKKGTEQDREVFSDAFRYWTQTYPKIPDVTRGGIITGFNAMASVMTGRGIYEMLCGETNLTPEMILSGKVIILDFPIKGNEQGGNMVQATWKLLFQHAVERRKDKRLISARPVFLWEDEAHLFFSQHDPDFQPTARDCRVSHVVISQNIHNFLHHGHAPDAVYSMFAAMNTYIFHTNGDHDTNCWASARIGDLRERRLSTGGLLKSFTQEDYSIFSRRPEEVKNVGEMSITDTRERAIPPEDFSKLKRGGDGTCEAVILWLSHKFTFNNNRSFCVRTFQQEARPNKRHQP